MTHFRQDRRGDRAVAHRTDAGFPKCRSTGVSDEAPPLESTQWGRELAEHEQEKRRANHSFYPWSTDHD